ncbi:XrtA-associated tyrosine autokinase [Candidatus Nitrotoga arctica]|uniref:non-specific protein-tyrosine kinase n=1 Tax=Candidatus Nitrotoga arctica TaxID=453162 RepID=A0ABM8Z134_9PROT|nr:XrtA-associated tyrosine autokinase [Candidatus Nitrotoga arctica]CAG9933523.1 AAA_31 domain-containing protein [Candidatus Nitrotoga arctica]
MSIIEKAANRFEQNKGEITPAPKIESAQPNEQSSKIINEHNARNLDRPIIAHVEINLTKLHQLGMITPDQGKTLAAQEFRGIKRSLIQNAFIKGAGAIHHGNLIMVTSSLPKEGKTFCAINLAMSIATEMDHTVLLIDADVARPSVLRTLGLKSAVGLMDILLDEKLDLAEVMINTNVDTLRILPAGTSHRHATELLASQAMSSLLNEISNRYPDRIVIFDSPPLLPTTEARVLASQMGQIVMVVEAETTTQHAVKEALRQIETNSNINLVYNKARAFPGGTNYGYGYYD